MSIFGIKLKECPFCGEPGEFVNEKPTWGVGRSLWSACCVNESCDVKPSTAVYKTKKECAEVWNRRAKSMGFLNKILRKEAKENGSESV